MADLRKAAYMALEFLEHVDRFDPNGRYGLDEKIDALIQALAQPEQAPVAWMYKNGIYRSDPSDSVSPEFVVTPLYTAPPSKPWVSLTDEQIIACGWCDLKFARAIEAASRSKNNG